MQAKGSSDVVGLSGKIGAQKPGSVRILTMAQTIGCIHAS